MVWLEVVHLIWLLYTVWNYDILHLSAQVVAAAVMNILCACGGGVLSLFAAFDMAINQLCSSKSLLTTTIQQPTTTWHWSDDATPTTTPEIIPTFGEETTRFDEEHYRICLVSSECHMVHLELGTGIN